MPCVIEDTLASDFMKPLYAIDLENGINQHELAKGIAMAQYFGSTFPPSCEHSGVALMQLLRSSSRLRSVHCFNVAMCVRTGSGAPVHYGRSCGVWTL